MSTVNNSPAKSTLELYAANTVKAVKLDSDEARVTDSENIKSNSNIGGAPYLFKKRMSLRKKWLTMAVVIFLGFLGPLTGFIYVPAIEQVNQSFETSISSINATVSLYLVIMGFAPLLWGSLSERSGHRAVYALSTLVYFLSTVGCGFAQNIFAFTAFRALQAIGVSAAQSVAAGTITDLFDLQERGNAMGLFLLGVSIGPILGSISGVFIIELLTWRSIFWCLSGVGGFTLLLIICFLPETSPHILKIRDDYNKSSEGYEDVEYAKTVEMKMIDEQTKKLERETNPKETLLPFNFLFKSTIVLTIAPYSVAYGFMCFVITSLPHQLSACYQLTNYQIGLCYFPISFGNSLGAYLSGILSDKALKKLTNQEDKLKNLENRLTPMWIGIILFSCGILLYGWSLHYKAQITLGLAGLFLVGLGAGSIQTPAATYITDTYREKSASAMGIANLLWCLSAACVLFIESGLMKSIGNGWSATILATISMLSGICILVVQRHGKKWRGIGAS